MLYKFFAHSNAAVFNKKFIIGKSCRRTFFFCDPKADTAAGSRIFYRIAQQVQKHLIKPQFITVDLLIKDIHRVNVELKLLCPDIRLQNIADPV